jgi:hypothetical protein
MVEAFVDATMERADIPCALPGRGPTRRPEVAETKSEIVDCTLGMRSLGSRFGHLRSFS